MTNELNYYSARVEFRTTPENKEFLKQLGSGNISAGFRKVLNYYMKPRNKGKKIKSANPKLIKFYLDNRKTSKRKIRQVMRD